MTGFHSAVVLDACVLVNYSLCDTLLRLAESPRLFVPKWSGEIIREAARTLESKLDWPPTLVEHLEAQLRIHFADAWISGYEALIPKMTNDKKDRHVAAAAIHGGAPIIITFNLRHFRAERLQPWSLQAIHPQDFLIRFFEADPELVTSKLTRQAADRSRSLTQLLSVLRLTVPDFVTPVENADQAR